MNNEFRSADELYSRLKPALYSRRVELSREHIDYIKEEDIWNYLVKNVWKDKRNLQILDLTNYILYVETDRLKSYVLEKLKNEKREIKNYEEEVLWIRNF